MSLVGSLEDLGLGEILQIISLSRKSGTLHLRSEEGEGWIVFRDGEILTAELKGGPTELRELLVARGALAPDEAERLARVARERGASFAETLTREGVASAERIAALRLDHVEASVLRMFQWATGEFSFEIGLPGESAGAADLALAMGVNPQFLALEGTRLQDERRSSGRLEAGAPASSEVPRDAEEAEIFAPVPELCEEAHAPQAPPVAAPRDAGEARPRTTPGAGHAGTARSARRANAALEAAPVVVVEPELPELERIKLGLSEAGFRVHIFQRSDLAIARIRQYLARGEAPVVILSARTPPDPLSGARDWREILLRLKGQAPRMPVLLLGGRGVGEEGWPQGLDGVLGRPEPGRERELGAALRQRFASREGGPVPTPGGVGPATSTLFERLDAAAARLRDPAFRGEVLPLVLRFAAELFSRVAIFMIRDGAALGMAQIGLPRASGPDDSGIRRVALRADEPAWFRRVLETRGPVCGPASDAGDLRLAGLLGNPAPSRAFVAPLSTGNAIVALLYADNLPGDEPLPETSALEALLRAAGLALDLALRARARN